MVAHPTQTCETIQLDSVYQYVKRVLDIITTCLLLPCLCLLMAGIALLIRLDSKGPVVLRQKRVGQHGVEFNLFKFRSMHVDADDGPHRAAIQQFLNGERLNNNEQTANCYKLDSDRRITRVGRFIRKTSLDELPQFFNVLLGQMTIVGPRPPLAYEVELYSPHDWLRLSGKPGLTGFWQVYGRSRVPFAEMVEMDLKYLRGQSFLLDLKLIILTIPVMLLGRGGA